MNSKGKYYSQFFETFQKEYEDLLWSQDAIFLERNSRNFITRAQQINESTEIICEYLSQHPKGFILILYFISDLFLNNPFIFLVKQIYYPKFNSKENYDSIKKSQGGYGGLFSLVLKDESKTPQFFDHLNFCKVFLLFFFFLFFFFSN